MDTGLYCHLRSSAGEKYAHDALRTKPKTILSCSSMRHLQKSHGGDGGCHCPISAFIILAFTGQKQWSGNPSKDWFACGRRLWAEVHHRVRGACGQMLIGAEGREHQQRSWPPSNRDTLTVKQQHIAGQMQGWYGSWVWATKPWSRFPPGLGSEERFSGNQHFKS